MKRGLAAFLVVGWVASLSSGVEAQTAGEVFRKVAPSVVVIRAKGHEVAASGQTRFNETGSGVLISPDGKVMTAAHVVHAMDEIKVEFRARRWRRGSSPPNPPRTSRSCSSNACRRARKWPRWPTRVRFKSATT